MYPRAGDDDEDDDDYEHGKDLCGLVGLSVLDKLLLVSPLELASHEDFEHLHHKREDVQETDCRWVE